MPETIVLPKHPLFKNLTGQIFGRLTVLGYAGRVGTYKVSSWRCGCACGAEVVVRASNLHVRTTSCGCYWQEQFRKANVTHGASKTPEYRVWAKMIERCENTKLRDYPDYGGRGITVCERWRHSFEAFLTDMGTRPADKESIDRKNNDGNYEPGNCRWANRLEQNRNKRSNHTVEFQGRTACITEWAEITGLPHYTIQKRLSTEGWTVEQALTTPKRKWSKAA